MSEIEGVTFNEEQSLVQHRVMAPKKAPFSPIGIVMRLGLASSEQGASTALACFAVVLIVAAAGTYLWSTVPHSHIPQEVTDDALHRMHANGY